MNTEPQFSFVIPALNEEKYIESTIRSIQRTMSDTPHEIILSDNGSTDQTVELAQQLGAKVIVNKGVNIAQLRNLGVAESSGEILVFIDADVQLSENWLSALKIEIERWPEHKQIVTGSTCLVPQGGSFVEQHWFSLLQHGDTNYINSGHLITTKTLFDRISGFDGSLRTAEDYDFCQRAKRAGATLQKAPNVKSYHYGYPQTMFTFMRREAWHGREDFSSIGKFLASKTAIAACINALLILLLSYFLLTCRFGLSISALLLLIGFVYVLTKMKFGADKPNSLPKTAFCFECYLLGRMWALFIGRTRPAARS